MLKKKGQKMDKVLEFFGTLVGNIAWSVLMYLIGWLTGPLVIGKLTALLKKALGSK